MDLAKHGFGLGSIALSLVALLLNIISLATVGWKTGSIFLSDHWIDMRIGLWESCAKIRGPGNPEHCGSTTSVHSTNLDATRGLELVAVLVGILAAVLTASLVFKFLEKALEATSVTSFMNSPIGVSTISFVSGIATIGALNAYGIDYSPSPYVNTSLNYSFYISIAAAAAYLGNGIVSRYVKVDSEESTVILPHVINESP